MGKARVESGDGDAESSKSDVKRLNVEVKQAEMGVRLVVVCSKSFVVFEGGCLRVGRGGLKEDLSCDLVCCK